MTVAKMKALDCSPLQAKEYIYIYIYIIRYIGIKGYLEKDFVIYLLCFDVLIIVQ